MYHRDEVVSVQFSNDGSHLLTVSKDKSAKLWETEDGSLLGTFQHEEMLSQAVLSDTGEFAATAAHDGAALWDASGKLLATTPTFCRIARRSGRIV
jgi:WD40 repeat protein